MAANGFGKIRSLASGPAANPDSQKPNQRAATIIKVKALRVCLIVVWWMVGMGFGAGLFNYPSFMESARFLFASFFDAVHRLCVHAIVAASARPRRDYGCNQLESLG
jgi:hypothetical protein